MGKWSRPTNKSGWVCVNCEEMHEDPPVIGQKSLNFEDMWIEDVAYEYPSPGSHQTVFVEYGRPW